MSLISILKGAGPSGFGYGSTAEQVTSGLDLSGKRYLITGCTSGLGAETMRVLILRGATVVGTARNLDKARAACAPWGEQAVPAECELSEPSSVRKCVADVTSQGHKLDGVIANAGIMATPELTVKHGLELQFLTNHIGHFLLITGLLPILSPEGRIVMLSSSAHNMTPKEGIAFDNLDGSQGYSPWKAYGQSKLANLLFAKELAKRLPQDKQTANAVHPGVINTGLQRSMGAISSGTLKVMGPLFLKSIQEGAATETFALTHPSLSSTSGEYLADCNLAKCSTFARDAALATKLWETTEQLVAKL